MIERTDTAQAAPAIVSESQLRMERFLLGAWLEKAVADPAETPITQERTEAVREGIRIAIEHIGERP